MKPHLTILTTNKIRKGLRCLRWILPIALISSACSARPNPEKDRVRDASPQKHSGPCNVLENPGDTAHMSCLKAACENDLGKKWNASEQICECGPGRFFSGYGQPACITPTLSEEVVSSADAESLAPHDSNQMERVLQLSLQNGARTRIAIGFTADNRNAKSALDDLDLNEITPRVGVFRANRQWELVLGPGNLSKLNLQSLLSLQVGDVDKLLMFYPLYFSDISKLKDWISGKRMETPIPEKLNADPLGREMSDILASDWRSKPVEQTESPSVRGCLETCLQSTVLPSGPQYKVLRKTRFDGGNTTFSEIQIFDLSQNLGYPHLIAQVSPLGNIFQFIRLSSSVEKAGIILRAQVFSDQLELIGELTSNLVSSQELDELEILKTNTPEADVQGHVIVCETSFAGGPQGFARALGPYIKLGPYSVARGFSSSVVGSPFGWMRTPVLAEYAKELRYISDLGFPVNTESQLEGEDSLSRSLHASHVSLRASGSGQEERLGIIPMRYEHCLQNFQEWSPLVSGLSKVVNLSVALRTEPKMCLPGSDCALPSNRNFLWVMGAGNDYSDLSSHVFLSPQFNSGRSDVIIVGAADGNGNLAHYSNRGKTYVDLLAPGTTEDQLGTDSGTSMAAPHVSYVTGLIAAKYPQLSPELIRYAVLTSVKVNSNLSETVRTSGILDPKAALGLAQAIAQNDGNLEKAIDSFYPKSFWGSERKLRLDLFKKLKKQTK